GGVELGGLVVAAVVFQTGPACLELVVNPVEQGADDSGAGAITEDLGAFLVEDASFESHFQRHLLPGDDPSAPHAGVRRVTWGRVRCQAHPGAFGSPPGPSQ